MIIKKLQENTGIKENDMDLTKLKAHLPENIYNQLHGVQAFGIDGPKRMSHFLGQVKTESNFTTFTENLNYSAEGLFKTFKKYFPTMMEAAEYAKQPERIANKVYGGRMGNTAEGDGWKYRGRGAIQLTGKDNYKAFGDSLGVDLLTNPDLVATTYPMASAAWFFKKNNLWVICDKGVTDEVITEVTKRVNGGTHGIDKRKQFTKEFYNLLTGTI